MFDKYGVDCSRLHMLYRAPVMDDIKWDETGIVGMKRWLTKVWRLVQKVCDSSAMDSSNEMEDNQMDDLLKYKVEKAISNVRTGFFFKK